MKIEDEIFIGKGAKENLLTEIRNKHPRKSDISKECIDKGIEYGVEETIDTLKFRLSYYIKQVLENYNYTKLCPAKIDDILNDIYHTLF